MTGLTPSTSSRSTVGVWAPAGPITVYVPPEKAEPRLSMSPPKKPVVSYIEHTTPVKFRRYVREGILFWNDAFEEIGVIGALEVRQQ